MRLLRFAFIVIVLFATPQKVATAFEKIETFTQTYTDEFILSNVPDFVATPEGGTDWQVFGRTKQIEYTEKGKSGYDRIGVRPEFQDDLKKLDGQNILVRGFMFPMDQNEEQSVFLLGPFPLTCPYHYHVSNNLIIETRVKKPLAFSYDAVTLRGRLELVPRDDDYNTFYRLHDAEPAK
ncbi:MAG: DUF3299 domain-containing protein [Alphaproteobacteria bacterium]